MTSNDALGLVINKAARDLPDGWQIHITIERGAGWAELYNPEGIRVDDFADGGLDLHESILHGIELSLKIGEFGAQEEKA
jgi:hypothetical protein